MAQSLVIMGVSGCGKSTIGRALAARLGRRFVEGDDLHPPENRAMMAAGRPLNDAMRAPWLDRIAAELAHDAGVVVSCSALKRAYRDRLRREAGMVFIHLALPFDVAQTRVSARADHFMPAALIDSQFATLEPPINEPDVIEIDATASFDRVLDDALASLARMGRSGP
ncbi:MAG: gluconokinase [Alphaproteobacteria bacterium]|nr:gluconokinase [Alphaproteobacteria bacterium]MBU1281681.1 gluconokinase [Alphaproteobacteria bacterium]MBU1575431.1 gluconokinase [Alphaproteobacteria bacterium]MBU1830116.1 gluconokinase [Alphaproteobacteria bacterium]MBU2079598.1 gluconokinase [Alphaproteobacteria bacterium]